MYGYVFLNANICSHGHAFDMDINSGSPPLIHKTNYEEVLTTEEGNSVNLTAEIVSGLPLTDGPVWSRLDDSLPSKAVVIDFMVENKEYSSIGISNLSFGIDSGNYSLSVSNKCGKTTSFVFINVKDTV